MNKFLRRFEPYALEYEASVATAIPRRIIRRFKTELARLALNVKVDLM
jgi:hypothetical protein